MTRKGLYFISGIFLILILIISSFIYTIHTQKVKIGQLEKEKEEKEYELELINAKIYNLEREINDSNSLQFVERIAREEYGMVKPKEVIFIDKDKLDKKGTYNKY